MDTEREYGGFSIWGLLVVLILVFWIINGNRNGGWGWGGDGCGWGGFGGWNRGWGFCGGASPCEVEKQEIINSARTQYLIEQKNAESTAQIIAAQNVTNTKIDFYAYQAERDKVAELQRQNSMLEGRIYADAQYNALNSKLDGIACRQLKAPEFQPTGGFVASTCNNFSGFNNGCGCGTCGSF